MLGALAGTDVPHPALIAACADEDVIGAAFYLMEPVDGFNPTLGGPRAARVRPGDAARRSASRWPTRIAALGRVDHVAAGLADLGKRDGWLERQVERWRSQLDGYARVRRATPGPTSPASRRSPRGSTPTGRRRGGPASSTATSTSPTCSSARRRRARRHRRLGARRRSATRCSTSATCSPRGPARRAAARSRLDCRACRPPTRSSTATRTGSDRDLSSARLVPGARLLPPRHHPRGHERPRLRRARRRGRRATCCTRSPSASSNKRSH